MFSLLILECIPFSVFEIVSVIHISDCTKNIKYLNNIKQNYNKYL